jgi:hypothetical protein
MDRQRKGNEMGKFDSKHSDGKAAFFAAAALAAIFLPAIVYVSTIIG